MDASDSHPDRIGNAQSDAYERPPVSVMWALLCALVLAGCAVGKTPDATGDAGPDSGPRMPDTTPKDGDIDPQDTDVDSREDSESKDTDTGRCGGCLDGETCHNGQCKDICLQAGASCGEATWKGATASCGSCGTGSYCAEGSCQDICLTTGATCGQVWWGGSSASCGSCGAGECVNNRCVPDSGYRAIAGGYRHTCAILSNGSVECWGLNSVGELGLDDDSVDRKTTPAGVASIRSGVGIASNNLHSCALTTSGKVYCWGFNDRGQLGNGSSGGYNGLPQEVTGLNNATSISAGNLHSCAVTGGNGACWGNSALGRLGNGESSNGSVATPQSVSQLTDVRHIESGAAHTCAIKSDGTVWCWGKGSQGQLGNGGFQQSSTPVQVTDLNGAAELAVGHDHACAVIQSGDVRCWGRGSGGRLGYGGTGNRLSPVDANMPSGVNAVGLAAGARFTCLRSADGEVYCWGEYQSQQGTYRSLGVTPTQVSVSRTPVELGAGRDHVCAVLDDGTARCWGSNGEGQLGDGTTDDSMTPVEVE